MSLDDAVNAAKAKAKQQAQIKESNKQMREQEEAEIQALVKEAADRLSSAAVKSERFLMVSPVFLFGGYSSGGKNYRVTHSARCWVLSRGESRRSEDSEIVPSSVLLVESGVMGRFYQEDDFHPQRDGEFVTASRLVQLDRHDVFWGQGPRMSRVDALKQALGTAIVTYGAT